MKKIAIVVPTIRQDSISIFIDRWSREFFQNKKYDVNLYIIEDNIQRSFEVKSAKRIHHFSWKEIDEDLGKSSWIIPRRTDCIRSYGYWKAWQGKPDLIITLDDDCYPYDEDFLGTHWRKIINGTISNASRWVSSVKHTIRPRGLPYKNLFSSISNDKIVLNHGLWFNVPDFDAKTQKNMKKTSGFNNHSVEQIIPANYYYPMSGMNIAWRPESTVALYFLLMGQKVDGTMWGYHRFGDIWAGIIYKKIADHLGYMISSGSPIIWHERASDVDINLRKEVDGLRQNETFWKEIDKIRLKRCNFEDCYLEIANGLKYSGNYWSALKRAMKEWTTLFG